MADARIELRDTSPRHDTHADDTTYRMFLLTSLALALFGGLLLAVLLSLAGALKWDWGSRRLELTQAHGQLQLLGFAGIYISGMALRLMPRFSGRPLAYPLLTLPVLVLMSLGVAVRSVAALLDNDSANATALIIAAALLLAGSAAFAAVVWRTLIARESRAEATAWFFVLGAAALVAQSALHLALAIRAVDDGSRPLPAAENNALLSLQLHGFVMMFIAGIATRAVTTLVGRSRSAVAARCVAVALAVGTAIHAGSTLASALEELSTELARVANAGLLVIAAALIATVWVTGVFHPQPHRVAAASQVQFYFVRAAFAWLVLAAMLLAWYAARAWADGVALDQFETDAVRHTLTVGVVTMIIFGMSMLIVPEFAGRRLQHPDERMLVVSMLLALNVAAVLRVWPAIEGIGWISSDRYWPIVLSGALTIAVTAAFTLMFVQSYLEQRAPAWGSPRALAERRAREPR